jgi:hypothetical protein
MAVPKRRQRQAISMQNGADNVGNGAPSIEDRFAGQLGYRGTNRREVGGLPTATGTAEVPARGSASVLDGPLPSAPSMSLGELDELAEPVYPAGDWMAGPSGSLADHPLLRGLLLELPAKGAMPTADWLDRWFEAARSILELLYVQHSDPGSRRDRLVG